MRGQSRMRSDRDALQDAGAPVPGVSGSLAHALSQVLQWDQWWLAFLACGPVFAGTILVEAGNGPLAGHAECFRGQADVTLALAWRRGRPGDTGQCRTRPCPRLAVLAQRPGRVQRRHHTRRHPAARAVLSLSHRRLAPWPRGGYRSRRRCGSTKRPHRHPGHRRNPGMTR
jgi:hypothetical protein